MRTANAHARARARTQARTLSSCARVHRAHTGTHVLTCTITPLPDDGDEHVEDDENRQGDEADEHERPEHGVVLVEFFEVEVAQQRAQHGVGRGANRAVVLQDIFIIIRIWSLVYPGCQRV
jgi:hypothetical protein